MTDIVEVISKRRQTWANKINDAWNELQRKTVTGIIELGDILLRAKAGLDHGEWLAMIDRDLVFSANTTQRIIKIALDQKLVNAAYRQYLPPHWRTLVLLSRLDNGTFVRLIEDGTINPEIEQKDVMKILRARARERRYGELVDVALPTESPVHILYMDPPWRYENPPMGDSGRSIENQYPTLTLDEIGALDIGACALEDALLFMWATAPKLAECMTLLEPWGFNYRTNLVWDKLEIGMGYYARNQHEILLIARRGSIPPPEEHLRPASVYREAVGAHSKKPVYYYELIERCYPGLRKREFFSRDPARPGWLEPWGNQVPEADAA